MSTEYQLILSTIDDSNIAGEIARILVDGRFAACVNIAPSLTSIYRWQDNIEETSELLMIIKTSADKVASTMEKLKEIHPYEVPEIITINIDDFSTVVEELSEWFGSL